MCMIYGNADIERLKQKAAENSGVITDGAGIELIRCVDGTFRTAAEKSDFEARVWEHLKLASY